MTQKAIKGPIYGLPEAKCHSGEGDPKQDAPRTAGEFLPKPTRRKGASKVVYDQHPVDEIENIDAFKEHKATRKKRRRHIGARKDEPYCHLANWLRCRRDHTGDDCLFLPESHQGFRADVRFNFRRVSASRAMCILAHGTPPFKGAMAIHSCGNGHLSCVNPTHLRWGTAKDNAADRRLHSGAAHTPDAKAPVGDGELSNVAAVRTGQTAATIRAVRDKK